MILQFQVTSILSIILVSADFCLASLNVTTEWKYVDYVWESHCQKAEAVDSGLYDYTKIIPNDIQPISDGRVLITTPRYFNNPASLSTISNQIGAGGPLLAPYPDWSWHSKEDCSGITSVNRIILDKCNRLWVIDSGKIGDEQVCLAKILAFDTITDQLLTEVEIPEELSHNAKNKSQGLLELLSLETYGKSCEDTWVYASDLEGYGLVIWDGLDIWRLNADAFYPDPDETTFTIDGVNFTLWNGPSGHGPITPDGYLDKSALMFKPMAGAKANAISLEDLHNSKSGSNVTFYQSEFTAPNQEISRAFSEEGGVMIAGFAMGLIACWNIQNPLETAYIAYLETNTTIYQFVSSIKITEDSESETQRVWLISNEFEHFVQGTMDWDTINYRIMTGDLDTLVSGTVCAPNTTYTVENSIVEKAFSVYEVSSDALDKVYPSYQ